MGCTILFDPPPPHDCGKPSARDFIVGATIVCNECGTVYVAKSESYGHGQADYWSMPLFQKRARRRHRASA